MSKPRPVLIQLVVSIVHEIGSQNIRGCKAFVLLGGLKVENKFEIEVFERNWKL